MLGLLLCTFPSCCLLCQARLQLAWHQSVLHWPYTAVCVAWAHACRYLEFHIVSDHTFLAATMLISLHAEMICLMSDMMRAIKGAGQAGPGAVAWREVVLTLLFVVALFLYLFTAADMYYTAKYFHFPMVSRVLYGLQPLCVTAAGQQMLLAVWSDCWRVYWPYHSCHWSPGYAASGTTEAACGQRAREWVLHGPGFNVAAAASACCFGDAERNTNRADTDRETETQRDR